MSTKHVLLLALLGLAVVMGAASAQEPPAPAPVPPTASDAWTASVNDFAAKADGTTDDTAAFQAALDAAAGKGGIVFVPAGTYLIAGALSIPEGVTLKGVWEAPHHADIGRGSLLYATGGRGSEDGTPFISLHQSSAVKGVTIFYPEQLPKDIQPYPWCIRGMGMHCSVIDVTLVNPYKGIDFGTCANELHYIENVFGQPLKVGIFIDKCTDIGRIQNVHFNPHAWGRAHHPNANFSEINLEPYLRENFEAFVIGRTDWEYMRDCFCIFAKTGYHFVKTSAGGGNAVLTQCGADLCNAAVQVDATQGHAGVAFENGQFMSTVIIGPENEGPVKFSNCGFWPIKDTKEQIIAQGKGTITLSTCHFAGWGKADPSVPCVRIESGSAIIQGCEFVDPKLPQIRLGEHTESAVITACRLRGGAKIENLAKDGDIQIGLNIAR